MIDEDKKFYYLILTGKYTGYIAVHYSYSGNEAPRSGAVFASVYDVDERSGFLGKRFKTTVTRLARQDLKLMKDQQEAVETCWRSRNLR